MVRPHVLDSSFGAFPFTYFAPPWVLRFLFSHFSGVASSKDGNTPCPNLPTFLVRKSHVPRLVTTSFPAPGFYPLSCWLFPPYSITLS